MRVRLPTGTTGYWCAWAATLLLLLTTSGCQFTRRGARYSYRDVPRELIAAKRENAQTVDLSRLASTTQNSELIDVGDVVEVSIASGLNEKDTVKIPVRINEAGLANLPVVGPVAVAGMEPVAAEAAIVAACVQRQLYRNPHVTVTMKLQRSNRITVVGAVEKPGVYQIPRGSSDLLAAIVAAGGLSEDAGTNVEIRNPSRSSLNPDAPGLMPSPPIATGPEGATEGVDQVAANWSSPANGATPTQLVSLRVDLVKATQEGRGGLRVLDGGIVMVEKRDPEPIHVIGLVNRPNRYELPVGQDLRVLDAVALAGGISSPVANRVYVIRKQPTSQDTVIVNLSLSAAKQDDQANVLLSPGDVVSVEQTPATVVLDILRYINFGFTGRVPGL